jgi:hypothetical protein
MSHTPDRQTQTPVPQSPEVDPVQEPEPPALNSPNVENGQAFDPREEHFLAVMQQMGDTIGSSVRYAVQNARSQMPAQEPRGSEPKANPPDEYDGKNHQKLEPFLAKCEIMFAMAPRRYSTPKSKVLAAASVEAHPIDSVDWVQ